MVRRAAFTLIELLVVVSIIAVLASILMPALSLVRESARSSNCKANLRSLAIGAMVYAEDSDGYLPCLNLDPLGVSNKRWWTNLVAGTGIPASWVDESAGQVDRGAWRCPSLRGENPSGGLGIYEGTTPRGVANYAGMAKLVAQFGHPSSSALMMDTALRVAGGGTVAHWSFTSPLTASWSVPLTPIPAQGRHRGTKDVNVLLADGHCEARSWAELSGNADDLFCYLRP